MKNMLKGILAVLGVALLTFAVNAATIKIDSVSELKTFIDEQKLGESDLVVFDVGMVLTKPLEPYFQMHTIKSYQNEWRSFMKNKSKKERDLALLYIIMSSVQIPTDEAMVKFVRSIQGTPAKTLALTALVTGSFDRITIASEWREEHLAMVGYGFSRSFPDDVVITFDKFDKYMGGYPQFIKGILYTNGRYGSAQKGDVLRAFMLKRHLRYKRIYMIDDRQEYLDEIAETLNKYYPGTEFIAIHYVGAYKETKTKVTKKEFIEKLAEIDLYIAKNQKVLESR